MMLTFDVTGLSGEQIADVVALISSFKGERPVFQTMSTPGELNAARAQAKCVGRDGNVEPEIAAKLFGAEPSVGNEPMKETRIFTGYKPE